jgi:hypothetical protein
MAEVAADVRKAAGIEHVNLARVVELGVEAGSTLLVTELAEGHTLRELLARKRDTGQGGFGPKGGTNIALHLCGALAAAHPAVIHGGLDLDAIVVSRAGRVKLGRLGLAPLAAAVARRDATPATAPEVLAGGRATIASDLHGLGALLYEILVGSPPVKGCVRPSQAVPGMPPAVDLLVARCMAVDPRGRPASAAEVRDALTAALGDRTTTPAASGSTPGAAPGTIRGRPVAPPPRTSDSLAASLGGGVSGAGAAVVGDDERWLISKGKLDYGPFTLANVQDQIRGGHILPGHVLIDKDTGQRTPVEDHPLVTELVEATRLKRDEERRAQAEVVHHRQEKRKGASLYVVIAVAVIGLGGGAYLLYSKLSASKAEKAAGISGLAAGTVETTMSFPSREERKARGKRRAGGKAGGTAGGWNDTVDLDLDAEGGDERLDDGQVNPVLQRSGGALGKCLTSTGTHKADIEFIVKGDGRVSQVRVNGETASGVANCIRGVMRGMQFPTFDGQRSKHYFDMAF